MTDEGFIVTVDTSSLTRSSRGQIVGVAYTTINGCAYPKAEWSDSVIPVLSSWLESLFDLANRSSGKVSLYFMDGPFRIEVANGGRWHMTAIDGRRADRVVSESDISPDDAIAAVQEAVSRTLEACSERNVVVARHRPFGGAVDPRCRVVALKFQLRGQTPPRSLAPRRRTLKHAGAASRYPPIKPARYHDSVIKTVRALRSASPLGGVGAVASSKRNSCSTS
jgi:hypothetical protein